LHGSRSVSPRWGASFPSQLTETPRDRNFLTKPGLDPGARERIPAIDWPRLQTLRYFQQGRGQRIFSLAFLTLFPRGEADWLRPRLRSKGLKFYDWIQHLMRYQDGRFAQHDRFRFAVFNIWMRELSSARSPWVVNKHLGKPLTSSATSSIVVKMTKNTLNWSDTTCLFVYLMICTTLLYCCLVNECVPRRLSS
jgi:hypothetical protein